MKQEEPTFPEKLFACWHPIRYGYEITDNPYGTFLLDQAVVVWRSSEDFPVFANEDIVQPERRSVYELHLPYTILLRLGWGGEKGMVYFFVSQPISKNKCHGYCIIGRNYSLEEANTILQNFEKVIFDQDKRIVES